jgi:F-type H+-transporting ATPase subunit epsilon
MFKLTFVTPEKKIETDQELEEITLPANRGELNILPGHSPLMTTLEAGIVAYKLKNGTSQKLAISWGYCQVSSDGVTLLAETAMVASEIDVAAVNEHLKQKEELLMKEVLDDHQWETLHQEISRLRAEQDLVGTRH